MELQYDLKYKMFLDNFKCLYIYLYIAYIHCNLILAIQKAIPQMVFMSPSEKADV